MLLWLSHSSMINEDKLFVIVLTILLPYSTDMRFVLFICISLLANMFHAAAMPVSNVDHMPLEVATAEVQHMDMHHAHMATDDLKSTNHCPDNGSPCCLALALQSFLTFPLSTFASRERHTLFPPHHPKRTLLAPFRPPKFYLS